MSLFISQKKESTDTIKILNSTKYTSAALKKSQKPVCRITGEIILRFELLFVNSKSELYKA